MTSLRIFSTSRPSLIGAPVLPMSKEDEDFLAAPRAAPNSLGRHNP
jgi:hypothetical protein